MNNNRLICPICKNTLELSGKSLVCRKNHSFDIARQGYVNLLPVQNKKSLHPGDTKEMLSARRSFLESGIYIPVRNITVSEVNRLAGSLDRPLIVDMGCGEGYYTCSIKSSVKDCECIGIDISKDAVKMACSRDKSVSWIAATAGCIPIESESTDVITAIFSLISKKEYLRILKKGGFIVEITAGNDHLKELKQIIYDEVYIQNKKPSFVGEEFEEIKREEHKFSFSLKNKELHNLLVMTPHLWRIKKENREKLEKISELTLTAHFWLRVLRKL